MPLVQYVLPTEHVSELRTSEQQACTDHMTRNAMHISASEGDVFVCLMIVSLKRGFLSLSHNTSHTPWILG